MNSPDMSVLRGFSRNVKQDSEANEVSGGAAKARCGRTEETSITGSRLWKIQMLAGIANRPKRRFAERRFA
jgi:hypothetical protein